MFGKFEQPEKFILLLGLWRIFEPNLWEFGHLCQITGLHSDSFHNMNRINLYISLPEDTKRELEADAKINF